MVDTDTKARAKAQALIQAHIPPSARGVDKRALYYALVEALTEAHRAHFGPKTDTASRVLEAETA